MIEEITMRTLGGVIWTITVQYTGRGKRQIVSRIGVNRDTGKRFGTGGI